MGLHNLLIRLKSGVSDTPDTSEESPGYQRKPSKGAGCTLDTPDTSVIDSTRERARNEVDPDRPAGQGLGKVSSKVSTKTEVSGMVSAQPLDREAWPERAAIAEYDGGLSRQDSEALADACCWPHSSAMNGAEIDTFTARLARFTDRGLSLDDAELLADKLVQRDRESDDRRVCLECAHLRHGGRCGNWKAAGVANRASESRLPADLVLQLQRCDGFATSTPNETLDLSRLATSETPF